MLTYRKLFDAVDDTGQAGLDMKLSILKKATGIDVEKTNGWRTIEGVRQAFGHGRAHQLRPDLDTPEFQAFENEHYLYHNPINYQIASNRNIFEKLKPIIDGGGTMASLTDRMRRSVPLDGSSVASDLDSGGGDYVFTRATRRGSGGIKETGLYWKASQLRRMDAIMYKGDPFGRTSGDYIDQNRLGQTVDSMREVGREYNETNFKLGLSIFDDIDRIVLYSQTEVDEAIQWMRSKGYKDWPDGRKLEEVIITKAKHDR
jgi:hypothetical protein